MKEIAPREQTLESAADEYRAALRQYVMTGGEAALQQGYEISRRAAAQGTSVLDVALMHHSALRAVLEDSASEQERSRRIKAAGEFLVECLSPHEMASRGFHEAILALRHFNDVLEQEAKRIAHALHDEAGQLLIAVHLALGRVAQEAPSELQSRFAEVTALLNQVEQELRKLSHELRPTILDDLGLVAALEFLATRFSKRSGIAVHVQSSLTGRVPQPTETALYRVGQEALTNAAKHSHARNVFIRLRVEGKSLLYSIRDDGAGFDLAAFSRQSRRHSLGFLGMEERVKSLQGSLQIHSSPGEGTEISIRVPVED